MYHDVPVKIIKGFLEWSTSSTEGSFLALFYGTTDGVVLLPAVLAPSDREHRPRREEVIEVVEAKGNQCPLMRPAQYVIQIHHEGGVE